MDVSPALVARLRAAGCVFAEEEAALLRAAAEGDALEALVVRRLAGEPLETVLGWAAFAGLRVACARGVFVPRRRSELLVAEAVAHLAALTAGPATGPAPSPVTGRVTGPATGPATSTPVLDLGCGTGALGAAVADRVPGAEVWAVDLDPAAVACAQRNLPGDRVLLGDLYDPLPTGLRFAAVLANAPYVPTGELALMPPEARDHEHRLALDGGPDGLDLQRRVAAGAVGRLLPGGALLVETGRRQADRTAVLLEEAGLRARVATDDEVGGTVVIGVADTAAGPAGS